MGSPRRETKPMKWTWFGVATTALSLTCDSCSAFLTGSARAFIPPRPTAAPPTAALKNRVAVAQPNLRRPRPYRTTTPRDRQEQQALHATSSNWFAQVSLCCTSYVVGESRVACVYERCALLSGAARF